LAYLPILGNNGKKTTQIIGKSKVDYTFYPIGTVTVEVMCSNHPFRVQTEEDRSRVLGFFGQLQQVLVSILGDSHERIVPNVLEWEVTEYDINKDIKVSDWFHCTALKIQVKHMDHLFSIYIKSMGEDTVYRIEERRHPHIPALDFINDVFNPLEKVEKLISGFREEQKQLVYAIEELMTVRKKEDEKEKGDHRNTSTVDLDNLLSLFHVPALPFFDIDESPSSRYVEVDERELESQYIELPNSDSDFDYLLTGRAVMIEPVCHWERVVRTTTEVRMS
jgi:hypothetical protein